MIPDHGDTLGRKALFYSVVLHLVLVFIPIAKWIDIMPNLPQKPFRAPVAIEMLAPKPKPKPKPAPPKPKKIDKPIPKAKKVVPPQPLPVATPPPVEPKAEPTPNVAPSEDIEVVPTPNPLPVTPSIPEPPRVTSLPGDRDLPIIESSVQPIYPKSALNLGLSGEIKIRIHITPSADIGSIEILKSTGHESLDNAYIRAIKRSSFLPKRIMGENKDGSLNLRYQFDLEEEY